MTQDEYNEAAALVVRLRKDLELHTDALKQSNAHCGTLLVQNEQLHSELVEVRSALAATTEQRDSLKRTLDEWSNADTTPHARLDPMSVDFSPDPAPAFMMRVQFSATPPVKVDDVADHVVPPVIPLCTTCHGCGGPLVPYGPVLRCHGRHSASCRRTNTGPLSAEFSPHNGPCKSTRPVRHE
jgi:hypothetical protein